MKMDDYNKAMARLEISDQCEERIMDMIHQEKKIRRHINKKAVVISVLAAAIACGSIGAAATFGGLRRNQEVWQQQRDHVNPDGEVHTFSYEKFDHNNYDMLQSAAEVIPEGEATTKTDQISVTAEDVYCDGRNLVCTFKAVTDQTEAMVLKTGLIVTINGQDYKMPPLDNSGFLQLHMLMLADQTEKGVYYGTLNFRIREELTETPEVSVTFKGFQCYENAIIDNDYYLGQISDKVTVDIPVTLKKDLLHDTEVGYESDAMKVLSVETSPAGIGVTYHLELGDWIEVFDENGNKIKRKEDGYLHSGNLYDYEGNIVEERDAYGMVYSSDWMTEFFEATDTDSITIRLVNTVVDPYAAVDELTVSLK